MAVSDWVLMTFVVIITASESRGAVSHVKGYFKCDVTNGKSETKQSPEGKTTPIPIERDCYDVQQSIGGNRWLISDVHRIQPAGSEPFDVSCDMVTDGGGWTVFQRRQNGSVDFFRNWADYQEGFGFLAGEHWLGNEKLHLLTNQKNYTLRVDLEDFGEGRSYAVYEPAVVAGASDKYRLTLGRYDGDAGDSLRLCDGMQFSTLDEDNDIKEDGFCSEMSKGGWWYRDCFDANLNGRYYPIEELESPNLPTDGLVWGRWKGHQYSVKKSTEMKLRPSNFI